MTDQEKIQNVMTYWGYSYWGAYYFLVDSGEIVES